LDDNEKSKFFGSYYHEQGKLDNTIALIDTSILNLRNQITTLSKTLKDIKQPGIQFIKEAGEEFPLDTETEPRTQENKENNKNQLDTSKNKKQMKITDMFRKQKKTEDKVFCKEHNELAAINVVTCKDPHIKNLKKSYYWCARKAIKPIGVDKNDLSKEDRKIYDSACNFFLPINFEN
jgi:hypothetical protein